MKKKTLFIIIPLIITLVSAVGLFFLRSQGIKKNRVCFKKSCFSVELAVTPEQRRQGLMSRGYLDRKEGMLFIFSEEDKHPFWMKNTWIPLDIIWINKNKEVVYISENTLPCKSNDCPIIIPSGTAQFVLEINSGTIKNIGLAIGDKLDITYSAQ